MILILCGTRMARVFQQAQIVYPLDSNALKWVIRIKEHRDTVIYLAILAIVRPEKYWISLLIEYVVVVSVSIFIKS